MGAGHKARLPRAHLRLPRRRGSAPDQRPDRRHATSARRSPNPSASTSTSASAEEHDARTAEMLPMPLPELGEDNPIAKALSDPQSMTFKAFANPPDLMVPGTVNTRAWRAAEIPAGQRPRQRPRPRPRSTARSPAAASWTARRAAVRVLAARPSSAPASSSPTAKTRSSSACLRASASASCSTCQRTRIVARGRDVRPPGRRRLDRLRRPETGVGFGYVMNKMIMPPDYFIDPRWRGLIDATYAALARSQERAGFVQGDPGSDS